MVTHYYDPYQVSGTACGKADATIDACGSKWTQTDCVACLALGVQLGNKTAARTLATVQAKDKDSLPRRIADAEGSQRGFKGSSAYGHDEYWDD